MQDKVEIEPGFYIRRRPESGTWFVYKRHAGRQLRWCTWTKDPDVALSRAKEIARSKLLRRRATTPVNHQYYLRALKQTRKNAKAKGLECDLTEVWLDETVSSQDGRCAVTDLPFVFVREVGEGRQPFYPSIDRMDNAVGYLKENCRIVCVAANYAMHTWGEWVLDEISQARIYSTTYANFFPHTSEET